MLYLIGIGLRDANDITLKGLEIVKKCDSIYLEGYTSLLACSIDELSKFYGKKVTLLGRKEVESDFILDEAKKKKIALLIIGDPFGATTHSSLILEAKEKGISFEVIHNATILSAIGETGLSLYKFGRVVSIPYEIIVDSVYESISENQKDNLHTLCLLDIRADENRYMTVNEAIKNLLELEKKHKKKILSPSTIGIGIARLSGKDQMIKSGKFSELEKFDFGKQPHCIIIPSRKIHFIEEDWIKYWGR